ncbi:MAG: hypothetical protein HY875_09435 [Chloroflexi bacterium]|nr:hypothetical protein [Chloroflexota bacterium]
MSALKLASVEPIAVAPRETRWDHGGNARQQFRGRQRSPARQRMLRVAVPGHDPETCAIAMELDASGELRHLIITDAASGSVLATLTPAEVLAIGAGDSGILFERKG